MNFFLLLLLNFLVYKGFAQTPDFEGTLRTPAQIPVDTIPYEKEKDGVYRSYYRNGEIRKEGKMRLTFTFHPFGFYKRRHGVWNYYTKEGDLYAHTLYRRGKRVMHAKYKNGDKVLVIEFEKGERVRDKRYKDGALIDVIEYK